ncbi:MAG: hypothetical protein IJQ28_02155, partial [Clostridia bacterium]|nr:hypothetical protein [Clostridia bacterium]
DTAGTLSGNQVTGKVVGVYDKIINILNSDNGGDIVITISCTNLTKVISIPQFTEYSLRKIKEGDTLIAYGDYSSGIFVASGITVTPANQ